jgi:hypothetical protein
VEVQIMPESGVTKGEHPPELPPDEALREEPTRRTQRGDPLHLVLHHATPLIGGNEAMSMDPLLEGPGSLFILEEASFFEGRMLDDPS